MTSAAEVRDDLTRERLTAAAAHLPGLTIEEFSADWWDGQAHGPCLIIRGGRRARRQRVVETGGEAVIIPFARRSAERWLAERRKPRRVELVVPEQRHPRDVAVDGVLDAVRCPTPGCGAMIPLGFAGGCPVCGDSAFADPAIAAQVKPRSANE
jgi:hypothetical protein